MVSFEISIREGIFLIDLAKKAILNKLSSDKIIEAPKNTPLILFRNTGVFVTLYVLDNGNKKLRGCIGYPYPIKKLVEALIDSAINAAFNDPRFLPVASDEFKNLIFEVSVLTPPKLIIVKNPIEYPNKIKIGEDGLIIERGSFRGLLLPQVPLEWGWNEEEFLSQCCIKAGLSSDNWKYEGINIYNFQALIFKEENPNGEIKRG